MMPGIPAGRQLAAAVSSGALAWYALLLASYSGVRDGPDGAAVAPRGAPPPRSHTPVKSGSFASAAQSAAVGAFVVALWPAAIELIVAETSTAATIANVSVLPGFMHAKLTRNGETRQTFASLSDHRTEWVRDSLSGRLTQCELRETDGWRVKGLFVVDSHPRAEALPAVKSRSSGDRRRLS